MFYVLSFKFYRSCNRGFIGDPASIRTLASSPLRLLMPFVPCSLFIYSSC